MNSTKGVLLSVFASALLKGSVKAANIARFCREQKELFELLVEEKSGAEANPRFVRDFKTLADVLVQETVRHDLSALFPTLQSRILGEENNHFTNVKGDSVIVAIQANEQATSDILFKVLEGNVVAAGLLSKVVHCDVDCPADILSTIPQQEIDIDDISIWIDPIDSTSEYIGGVWSADPFASGLHCACILIGAFSITTGQPLFGIINQPFHRKLTDGSYESRIVCSSTRNVVVSPLCANSQPVVLLSSSEKAHVVDALRSHFEIRFVAGAGYKMLQVVLASAVAYVVSGGTTFQWDTCGPHAILHSLGGEVVTFASPHQPIHYQQDKANACNSDGIIAYRDVVVLTKILAIIDKL